MNNIILNFVRKNKRLLTIILANLAIFLSVLLIIFGKAVFSINHLYIGIEGDSSFYMWITKWFSRPFSHADIFHATNVYFPMGIDISAGWEGSILYYYGGLLNSLFSESAAYNLLILTPLFLSWVSVYYVFNKLSNRLILSGLFSTLFCTSSFFIARSLGHPTYLYFFHIPLLFYFLQYDWLKNINLKKSLLLVAVYVLISITSWYYFIFAIIITAIYLISFVVKNGKSDFAIYKKIFLTYAGVLIAVIIFNFPMFKAFLFGSNYFYPYPFHMNNEPLNEQNSMHLIEYFKPSTLNIFYSNHPLWQIGNIEKILFPGLAYYILLAVSVFLIAKKKSYKKYYPIAIIGLLFIIFSLGYNSPLPLYKILNSLPFASSLHAPSRFGIVAIFAGWILIVQTSRYFKGRTIGIILALAISLQLYETTKFQVPFQNFNNLAILKKIDSGTNKSPILELPMRVNISETLLIPALTNRPVFSGYPQHTTYSPQLNYYALNNVLDNLGTDKIRGSDITARPTTAESAAYLKWKFGVEDVVLNKQLDLSPKASEILNYFSLAEENNNYAIYRFEKIPDLENDPDVKIVTGKGIGQLVKGGRNIAEKAELDILNFSDQPQKLKLHFVAAGIAPDTDYAIDGNSLKNDVVISAPPGLGTLTVTSDKKCTVQGADCITGTISEISLEQVH